MAGLQFLANGVNMGGKGEGGSSHLGTLLLCCCCFSLWQMCWKLGLNLWMWLMHVPVHLGSGYILWYRVPRERTVVCSQQYHHQLYNTGLQPFSSGFPSASSISNSCEHTARQKEIFLSFLGGGLMVFGFEPTTSIPSPVFPSLNQADLSLAFNTPGLWW